MDRNQDVVLANELATAMFPSLLAAGNNILFSIFEASEPDRRREPWISVSSSSVAALRYYGEPTDPRMRQIVGTLSVRDADFRRLWADHHARPFDAGTVLAPVEGFGFGPFPWQILEIPGGFYMVIYLAVEGEFSGDAIEFVRASLREAPDATASGDATAA